MEGRRSWFMMAPKRRSSEAEDTVIRQGCLIKSPPTSSSFLFTSRTSWKGRLIKVCRTPIGSYYIRYYSYNGVTEEWKGDIAFSDIQSIELGTNIKERIQTVLRLFNNSPEHVLCIKTSKRDYYLVDDNEKNISDWRTCLTDIWVKINSADNAEGPRIANISSPTPETSLAPVPKPLKRALGVYRNSPTQSRFSAEETTSQFYESLPGVSDEAARPKSYPQDYPRTESAVPEERQRSLTDPEKQKGVHHSSSQEKKQLEPPEEVLKHERCWTHSGISSTTSPLTKDISKLALDDLCKIPPEGRRFSEDSAEVDAAYISDPEQEEIYAVPSSIPLGQHPSLDYTEGEDSEFDSPDEHVYVKMESVPQHSIGSETELTSTPTDQIHPKPQEVRECSCSGAPEPTGQYPKKPIRTSKLFTEPISEQRDCKDSVRTILCVPTAHLQKYLGLQEVGERLCVSKWKGPSEIGCLFHYGDHIEAINGVRAETKDFFLQILNKSIKEEVTLVVSRNTKAGVFHVEGCQCGES